MRNFELDFDPPILIGGQEALPGGSTFERHFDFSHLGRAFEVQLRTFDGDVVQEDMRLFGHLY